MEEIYQQYLKLSAGQRKLLCLLAYTGRPITDTLLSLYAKGESLDRNMVRAKLLKLTPYFKSGFFSYYNDYELRFCHRGPLLVLLLCEQPDWLRQFEQKYKHHQMSYVDTLITQLRLCIMGRYESSPMITDASICNSLVALGCHKTFLPYLKTIPAAYMPAYVADALLYQAEHDLADPDQVINQLASQCYPSLLPPVRNSLRSLVALFGYWLRGTYDAEAAALDTLYAHTLYGLHALFAADAETAFKQFTMALRLANKDAHSQQKGFFTLALSNYALVMAYHLKESDQHKKLAALLKKELYTTSPKHAAAACLANYLVDGSVPSKNWFNTRMNDGGLPQPLYKYLLLVAARFFGIEVNLPTDVPPVPRMHLLRHELAPWLPLSDDERHRLEAEYGGPSLISHIRYKQPWELLLEELTPKEATAEQKAEKQVRVAYVVNYERVEMREQHLLKSGQWGAGKRMSVEAFRRGTDFMDDTDRKIASSIRGWYSNDIAITLALPHLIGSNRVFTGHHAPLQPVTIAEEKPYLIIERKKNGFVVKSNMGDVSLDKSVIYRRDSETHYTVITITPQQRLYYKKLLQMGTFPLEAEPLLRQFLPKVSDVVEVHSDLVEGGSTLQHRDGSPVLCLQVMPMAGTRNTFHAYCFSRPLPGGTTLFSPGTGLNPCVAEADGTRYQVTRDMRGERENLQLLRTFFFDNKLLDDNAIDEPFADRQPVTLSAEALLQTMLFLQEQKERFALEWPEGGQVSLKTADTASWNIGLKSKNGWFEVEGEVPIDEETVLTAAQFLQLVAESRQPGFIRLGEGQFLAITERLRKQLSRLESLTTNHRGHLQINELHASLLGSALSGEIEIHHDKKIEKLQAKIEKSLKQRPATPKLLKAQLRDYQQDGYQWLCRMTGWGAGVCLADDMGLGKTVQTIAFLLHVQDEGPALVAAPASVVLNWRRELQRFAPSLNVFVLNAATDRQQVISDAAAGDVVLTTYGLFVTESESLQQKQWNTICLDEAHTIQNRETKTSQAVMQLQAAHRIILTGTPVQNHLGELWNLYQFINPGLLGSYDQFQQKYITPIEQHDDKERSHQLRRIIQPFILRRTKQEVVEELPEKTEITMPVELSADEMAVYEVIRRRAKELLEADGGGSPSVNTLAEITRLRQAACSAQLAEKSWTGECSKINMLVQLVEEIVGGGNSVLVFSQFTSFLALVRQALDKAGQAYAYLDGSVPMKQRDQLVQDFQHGRQQVFLISLKAGGLGLNLTGANYVIHLDPWWNPAIEQQATDRAYRIGQRQNVTVYHLISQHTIEEKILRLHETKRNLADAMLEGTSQSHKLSSEELLQMLGA